MILKDFGSYVCVTLQHWEDGLKVVSLAKTCTRCEDHLPDVESPLQCRAWNEFLQPKDPELH